MKTLTLICSCILLNVFFQYQKGFSQANEIQNPTKNFEALWQKFNLHYANFELKKVDWNEIYQKYRPMVTDSTNNKELFEICCAMVQELNDGHVTIVPDFEKDEDIECGPPYDFFNDREFSGEGEFKDLIEIWKSTLKENGFGELKKLDYTKEYKISYSVSDDFGYLNIPEMAGPTFGKVSKAMKEVMAAFEDKKGAIIDLRLNGGG